MRRILLSVFIVALATSPAFAQGGRIGLFQDTAGTDCSIADTPGLATIEVVHFGHAGATASEFMATVPACVNAPFLSWAANFGVSIGSTETGVSVAYGACLPGAVHVGTISFFAQGLASQCCLWPVTAHGLTGVLVTVDCSPASIPALGQSGLVNESAPGGGCECNDIVASHQTTWGGVKAIFSNQN